jgi:hypothetical protein
VEQKKNNGFLLYVVELHTIIEDFKFFYHIFNQKFIARLSANTQLHHFQTQMGSKIKIMLFFLFVLKTLT